MSLFELRIIASDLPSSIYLNDIWRARGSSEWSNVTALKPLLDPHHQPRLPTDLGLHAPSSAEVREASLILPRKGSYMAFVITITGSGEETSALMLRSMKAGVVGRISPSAVANETGSDALHGEESHSVHGAGAFSVWSRPRFLR